MNYDPEIEFYLSEIFGRPDNNDHASAEKSTLNIDKFFAKADCERFGAISSEDENVHSKRARSESNELREFVKTEKQRLATDRLTCGDLKANLGALRSILGRVQERI